MSSSNGHGLLVDAAVLAQHKVVGSPSALPGPFPQFANRVQLARFGSRKDLYLAFADDASARKRYSRSVSSHSFIFTRYSSMCNNNNNVQSSLKQGCRRVVSAIYEKSLQDELTITL